MKMAVSVIDVEKSTDDELLAELKSLVAMRNRMGGAMYYNMCNDDAHQIAHVLLLRGKNKPEDIRDLLESTQ